MPWLRSSVNKVQTNVVCCWLIVNYGVALHRTCYTIVCIVPWCPKPFLGDSSTRSSLLKWLPDEGKDIFRWMMNKQTRVFNFQCFSLCYSITPSWNFYWGPQNRHGIFWGLIFGPGSFLGFAGSPRDFFGSWLSAPFDHPRHLKSQVPPGKKALWFKVVFDCFFQIKTKPVTKCASRPMNECSG